MGFGGGKMLVRCYRGKLSVWAALCVLVLCWFYIFPGDRLPRDKEIVEEVLRQGEAWHRNQTGIDLYRCVSGRRRGGGGGGSDFCALVFKAVFHKARPGAPTGSPKRFFLLFMFFFHSLHPLFRAD